MTATIWHNPRCSKSRQTLVLRQDTGLAVDIVDYQKTPPSIQQITSVLALLNMSPVQLIRTGDKLFTELGLSKTDPDRTLIQAMANHPALIERPVVLANGKTTLGRPPETVLTIL